MDPLPIDSDGRFEGYASVFGKLDDGGDIVMPGAFRKSLGLGGQARRESTSLYVLIRDGEIEGTFDTYEDALKVGYSKFKLAPFLVKQIAPSEQILSFTRDLHFAGN